MLTRERCYNVRLQDAWLLSRLTAEYPRNESVGIVPVLVHNITKAEQI